MIVEAQVVEAEDYYWRMAARERLIYIERLGCPWSLCTFFVLPDVEPPTLALYHQRALWSSPMDLADGPVIYIDKLWGGGIDRPMARRIEQVLTQRVPSWRQAIWFRPTSHGPDRRYTYWRRVHGADV